MIKSILKIWLSLIVAVIGLVGATEVAAQTGFGISPTSNLLKRAGTVVSLINSAWTLGDSSNRIAAVYTSLLDATSLSLGGTVAGDLTVGGNATIYGSSGATAPKFTATSTALALQVDGLSLLTGNVTTTAGLTPATANAGSVGSLAYPYATGYFGTSLASPAISVTSTGAGITLYNTTDQVTNYERADLNWSSNVFTVGTLSGGSGSTRTLRLQGGKATWARLDITRASAPFFSFGLSNNTGETGNGVLMTFTNTISAGNFTTLSLAPTISQSGTAGYTALLINPTQSSTGSGDKLLADFQVGGTSQLKIDNAGYVYAGGSYASLTDGDGYYFGDSVRGLRYLTGDDFEFQNWHVGGQFYMSVYNGSARTRFAVFDSPTKRAAFSDSVDLRNYTPNTSLEVIGTASATSMIIGDGSGSTPSLRFGSDLNTGIWRESSDALTFTAGGVSAYWTPTAFYPATTNGRDIGTTSAIWRNGYFGGTVSTTNILASGVSTSTYFRATADGDYATPGIGWTGIGLTKSAVDGFSAIGGGQFLMTFQPSANLSYTHLTPSFQNLYDLGSLILGWRHGYFDGQVSSTSLIVSATGTIGRLGLGNNQDHDFATALMKIKHTPSQAEAATLDYIQMTNTSSTRDMAISFLDDTETNSILRISAFGRNYGSGDFGFSPANMAFFETVSGTVMLAGDGIAVFNAAGVFRPITGIGFGNNDNIDPFNATASTTITNGNMSSASLDFPNSAAAGTQDLTITVMGATDGDECQLGMLNALASRASEAFTCFVSAADTITVRRTCVAGAGCGDPGASTVKAGFFSRS